MPYKKILIALEGIEKETAIVNEAVKLADALGSELSAFHINDPAAGKAHMMMDGLPLVEEKDLRELIEKAGQPELAKNIAISIVESDEYANSIADAAKGYDMLIIGHKSKSQIKAVITDSVDERVSDLVSCPILVVTID